MSDRNQDILRQLIKNKKIKEETLLTEFGVTSRQLSYTIQNINDKLVEKGLAIIEKQQGHFVCPRETIDYLTIHQTLEDIVFSKEDRMYLILIMILTRKEELSLDHFSIELKMSKNTIVNDIKQTMEFRRQISFIGRSLPATCAVLDRCNTLGVVATRRWGRRRQ